MKQEERKKKIDSILGNIKKRVPLTGSIPIHLWIAKPGTPDFEEWLKICTQLVDIEDAQDMEHSFAIDYVRKYGRRKYEE